MTSAIANSPATTPPWKLDEGTDPKVIAEWITQAQQHRTAAQAQLHRTSKQEHMTEADIAALTDEIADHTQALASADPAHKADVYGKLGLQLTYQPEQQTVRAEAHLDPAPYGEMVRVRGRIKPVLPNHLPPTRRPTVPGSTVTPQYGQCYISTLKSTLVPSEMAVAIVVSSGSSRSPSATCFH